MWSIGKMNKKLLIWMFVLFLVPISVLGYGWGRSTLEINAEIICAKFSDCVNLKCMDEIREGAIYPSYTIRDYGNMDYYRECTIVSEPWCYVKDETCKDCTTGEVTVNRPIDEMDLHITLASGKDGCDKYNEIGKALNYFLQSKNYWHQVIGEKSFCVSNFENDVEQFFEAGQTNAWTVQSCEKLITADDFTEWVDEFTITIEDRLGAERTGQEVAPTQDNQGAETTITNEKCVFEDSKYLTKFCEVSRKTESTLSRWGDPFVFLLAAFVVFVLYVIIFKRG